MTRPVSESKEFPINGPDDRTSDELDTSMTKPSIEGLDDRQVFTRLELRDIGLIIDAGLAWT